MLRLKMRDLVQRTGVTKETIHHFRRRGLLPVSQKTSPNQAVYTEEHVERILFIKKLQEQYFLPLTVIEKIIDRQKESLLDDELMQIKSDYFKPTDHLLPEKIIGEEKFLDFVGLTQDRLIFFEEHGIIEPEIKDGKKIYNHDMVKIGKLIGDLRRVGLSYENGFDKFGLKEQRDLLMPVLDHMDRTFRQGLESNDFTREEIKKLAQASVELMPLYVFYIVHVLSTKRLAAYIHDELENDNPE